MPVPLVLLAAYTHAASTYLLHLHACTRHASLPCLQAWPWADGMRPGPQQLSPSAEQAGSSHSCLLSRLLCDGKQGLSDTLGPPLPTKGLDQVRPPFACATHNRRGSMCQRKCVCVPTLRQTKKQHSVFLAEGASTGVAEHSCLWRDQPGGRRLCCRVVAARQKTRLVVCVCVSLKPSVKLAASTAAPMAVSSPQEKAQGTAEGV